MRCPELAVISDLHLATRASRARQVLAYLDSIRPRTLVLAGDILDLYWSHRGYWPDSHQRVLDRILRHARDGVEVVYLTGNHDGALAAHHGIDIAGMRLARHFDCTLDGRRTLVIHGDQVPMRNRPPAWRVRVADSTYDHLLEVNGLTNRVTDLVGVRPWSLATWVKLAMPGVDAFMHEYRQAIASHAAACGYEMVVCGHIHHPEIVPIAIGNRTVTYLNSGDWVEHASALEYADGAWTIHHQQEVRIAAA